MKKKGKQRKMDLQYAKPLVPEKDILDYLKGLGFQIREVNIDVAILARLVSEPIDEDRIRLCEAKKEEFMMHVGFPLPQVMFFIVFFPQERTKVVLHDKFMGLLDHLVAMGIIYCYAPEEIPWKVMVGLKSMGEIHDATTKEKL